MAGEFLQILQHWLEARERFLKGETRQAPGPSPILAETAISNGNDEVRPIWNVPEDIRACWGRLENGTP